MLGQGHKITMSRWPNCPNMCGANEVRCPNVWCQDCPKIRGHRGQGQMMAAILDLLRQTNIYMASLVVKVIYTLIDYLVWCQDW